MKQCFLYYMVFLCVLLSCEREKPVSGYDTYQEADCDCDDLENDKNVTFIIRGNDFYLRAIFSGIRYGVEVTAGKGFP